MLPTPHPSESRTQNKNVWIVVHSGSVYALRSESGVLTISGPLANDRAYAEGIAAKLNRVCPVVPCLPDRPVLFRANMIDSFSGEYDFLSNFYPSPVRFDGVTYPSVENAYQAAKTVDFLARKAFVTATPGKAKRLGRALPLRKDWESIKLKVMRLLLDRKFTPETELANLLIATAPNELIEGNHWGDTFWGVCDGEGQNNLGKLLMEIRAGLIDPCSTYKSKDE